MNIYKNGYIVDNSHNINFEKIKEEKHIGSYGSIGYEKLLKILKGDYIIPVFRLYLLDENEQILFDVSEDLTSASLNITYQTGQRRTMSITLANIDGKWTPKPVSGLIWIGSKFRFDTGIIIDGVLYWKQQGVFVFKDPSLSRQLSNSTISLSLCDKFGIFDGTVFGTTSLKTIIPVETQMKTAFNMLLTSDRGNGVPFDMKPLIFNSSYANVKTSYTIKQDAGSKISELFLDMGKTISADVYYNPCGNMTVDPYVDTFTSASFPVVYRYEETDKDITSIRMSYNSSQVRNKIVVKGAIKNGYQFSATAENKNLKSDYCIQYNGEIPEVITDNNLYSDSFCAERAMYELINATRGTTTLNISSTYNPIFDVNQAVEINYPSLGINDMTYLIDNISMNIGSDTTTSLTLTNINEVIF